MTSITCCGVARLEIEGVEVAGEHRDVSGAEIGHHLRRVLQRREAEERRGRSAQGPLHRAETFLDFFLALVFGQFLVGEGRVRPGMRSDGVTGRGNLFQDLRIVGRVLADRKENAGRALVRQRLQYRGRIDRPGAVVKRQHHFLVAQEIELLEVLETEPRSARGVDLDDAADPKRIRIGARRLCRRRRRCGDRAPAQRSRQVRRCSWGPGSATTRHLLRTAKPLLQRSNLPQYAWCSSSTVIARPASAFCRRPSDFLPLNMIA